MYIKKSISDKQLSKRGKYIEDDYKKRSEKNATKLAELAAKNRIKDGKSKIGITKKIKSKSKKKLQIEKNSRKINFQRANGSSKLFLG